MVARLARRRRRTLVGLDIGTAGVRAAQLVRSADRYTVTCTTAAEWPPAGAKEDGSRELPGRIRNCMRQGDFRGRAMVTGLQPPAVEFHPLELPAAVLTGDDANTAQVIHWELGRLATQRGDRLETRHWLLPPTKVAAPSAIGVAASRDVIDERLAWCGKAGLLCVAVDAAAAALVRLGATLRPWTGEDVWGVLDVGYGEARLVMCLGQVPVLVRQAGPGSQTWTERIAESLQLSLRAAEVQKREHGVALSGRGVRPPTEGDAPPSEVAGILLSALRSELKYLASEVKRSYEYVLSCYAGRQVGDLILVGGGALMRNLPEFLSQALGIRVQRPSDYLPEPGCRLRYEPANRGTSLEILAQAVGLAIEM